MGPGQKGGNGAGKGRGEASVGGDWPGMSHDPSGAQAPRGTGSQMTASLHEHPGDRLVANSPAAAPQHNRPSPCNLLDKQKLFLPHLPGTPNKGSEF